MHEWRECISDGQPRHLEPRPILQHIPLVPPILFTIPGRISIVGAGKRIVSTCTGEARCGRATTRTRHASPIPGLVPVTRSPSCSRSIEKASWHEASTSPPVASSPASTPRWTRSAGAYDGPRWSRCSRSAVRPTTRPCTSSDSSVSPNVMRVRRCLWR